MKTAHELNAPTYATHYTLKNGVATYYHIDKSIFIYSVDFGWEEYIGEPLIGLIEI